MNFSKRHIGLNENEEKQMLSTVGVKSIKELIDKTIPSGIRLKQDLQLDSPMSEYEYLQHATALANKNKIFKTYIGKGYYNTITPSVILRNIFENPGWYTAYTPYQAEISQGRLEAILNFQTMVMDLTQMEIANGSLLDESTAAAEAMLMFFASRSRDQKKNNVNKFFLSENAFPQTIDVVLGRAENLDIEVEVGQPKDFTPSAEYFGAIVQYPDTFGEVKDLSGFISKAHEFDIKVGVAADLMALAILTPPGKWGADAVFGNTQRFGVPLGYGGPHAAYFATKEEFKRNIPGRIIGISIDADGNEALRMALQTREQHIKRDKATSNICTAQALLAIMAGMYAVYHGPQGLKEIASSIHAKAVYLGKELEKLGFTLKAQQFFDTITLEIPSGLNAEIIESIAIEHEVNFNYLSEKTVGISVDETTSTKDIELILNIFSEVTGGTEYKLTQDEWKAAISPISDAIRRAGDILTHPVFSSYHTESKMMRYIKKLENKDLSLVHSMISLGSCTMKLNAASELIPVSYPGFSQLHPFIPVNQAEGYSEMLQQLHDDLCEITGFAGMSLQPNSGAQGEYAGLMVIKAYHLDNGDQQRKICLIPSSAHGTNPASTVMAGMEVVVVKCDDKGNIDVADLKAKAEKHSNELAALMITYPSTHGVFEASVIEITSIIHQHGGQVYMDGANMNAQVGLTNPGNIGADVCHLNLHKTFAIPHGGGGPGMGPIGVAKHLVPFLPGNPNVDGVGGEKAIRAISGAPFGSASILAISYGYIKMLGAEGLRNSTEIAILNANYIKAKLEQHYPILYTGESGTVAHEMILDCRAFKRDANIEVADIAKRLIDYNFHAPTVSFPVAGTLMIEPTESEDKAELDRFIEAMISIKGEIDDVISGKADSTNNVLMNAPHPAYLIMSDDYNLPYSRKQAAYPVDYLSDWKYWVPVRRVDNAHGDRNLICACAPIEDYMEAEV
ncbi:MAG: aminomethyl-transferring glycine dehydrogenase [Putridiphycobacter sp.]|nr:aminomethyl-transferring glycine dehydrogenase [Putridiphycobacter sp.]